MSARPQGAEATAAGDRPEDRLPYSVCVGFGVGSLGISIMLNTVTVFFPVLMTTVLGQSAALAGILLTVSKIYDAISDIVIGVASDHTVSRMGRRRPYLLAGAFISALSFMMIFMPPSLDGAWFAVYMGTALIVYSTGYSLFAVPYVAMAGEMTDGYHERTRLLSYRTFFIAIGQLVAAGGMAAIVRIAGGGSFGYAIMGAAAASIILTTMILSFAGTAKARRVERAPKTNLPKMAQVASLARNAPFVRLMGAKAFLYLAIAVVSTTKLLFLLNVLGVGYDGLVHLTVSQNLVAMATVPAWTWAGRRYGKTFCYLLAIAILTLLYGSYVFTGAGISVLELWVRGAVNGIAASGVTLMGIAMLPDAMEYDRKKTGQRREGLYSSIYAMLEKVAFAIGPGLIGVLLAAAGFVPTTGGQIIEQSQSAVQALYAGMAVIPALLTLISFAIMATYRLDAAALKAIPEYDARS